MIQDLVLCILMVLYTILCIIDCERLVSICKANLQKRKHRQKICVTCLILCCSISHRISHYKYVWK